MYTTLIAAIKQTSPYVLPLMKSAEIINHHINININPAHILRHALYQNLPLSIY